MAVNGWSAPLVLVLLVGSLKAKGARRVSLRTSRCQREVEQALGDGGNCCAAGGGENAAQRAGARRAIWAGHRDWHAGSRVGEPKIYLLLLEGRDNEGIPM